MGRNFASYLARCVGVDSSYVNHWMSPGWLCGYSLSSLPSHDLAADIGDVLGDTVAGLAAAGYAPYIQMPGEPEMVPLLLEGDGELLYFFGRAVKRDPGGLKWLLKTHPGIQSILMDAANRRMAQSAARSGGSSRRNERRRLRRRARSQSDAT